jgi:hypothetical protein
MAVPLLMPFSQVRRSRLAATSRDGHFSAAQNFRNPFLIYGHPEGDLDSYATGRGDIKGDIKCKRPPQAEGL